MGGSPCPSPPPHTGLTTPHLSHTCNSARFANSDGRLAASASRARLPARSASSCDSSSSAPLRRAIADSASGMKEA
eukprot:257151-Chlamydomonas_euryale.AAC.1